jgi:hypothetical protein
MFFSFPEFVFYEFSDVDGIVLFILFLLFAIGCRGIHPSPAFNHLLAWNFHLQARRMPFQVDLS